MGSLLQDVLTLFSKKKFVAPLPYVPSDDDYFVLSNKGSSSLNVMAYLPKVDQNLISAKQFADAIVVAANTTYDYSSIQAAGNVDLKLTGSDATVDTVKLVAGTNITLTDNGSNQVTIAASGGSGSVTSINFVTDGTALNVNSNTITSSGTMTGVWQGNSDQYVNGNGDLITFPAIPQGTVTSVAASTAGNALDVGGTPITSSGTLAFTWAGSSSQYINGAGNLATLTSIETDTLQSVTTRGASSSVATNFTGSLTVNGSNAGAYFYVSGNAQSTTPPTTYNTGMAMVWNNSGGSRENEMYYASGAGATQAENNASYFAFINRFNTAGTPVDQTTLKLYGDGNLELTGPASTSTIANAYWRMPKVAAPNTGYILAKSSGSINLEWIQANTYNNNISGVPSTATSTGSAGSIRFDANFIYVCYATNSWRRVAVAAW